MKKLMIIGVVLGMSIAANAAVTQWSLTGFFAPTTSDGSTITLDSNSPMTWSAGKYTLYIVSQASGHVGELVAVDVSPTIADGSMAATTLFNQVDSVTMRDTYGDANGVLYMKIIGSYSDADYDYVYDSGIVTKSLKNITGSTNAKFTFYGSKSKWTATAVPEPTSGLLLLLGMAGLALRRRRA